MSRRTKTAAATSGIAAVAVLSTLLLLKLVGFFADVFWTISYETKFEGSGLPTDQQPLVDAAIQHTMWIVGIPIAAAAAVLAFIAARRYYEQASDDYGLS